MNNSENYKNKIENLKKARAARAINKQINDENKNKVLTTEEKFERDLIELKKVDVLSKKIFGKKSTLSKLETKLNKIGNVGIKASKAKSGGRNYFRVIFYSNKFSNYQNYNRQEIKNKGFQLSKELKKMGLKGTISTCLDFDGVIRSGQITKIGEDIDIYQPNILSPTVEDEEIINKFKNINKFNSIVFYVHAKNKKLKVGGAGINNDCLWYCINKAIPDFNPWKYPQELKIFLRLERNDMINIDCMEKIEKHIGKVGINITGDYTYTSKLGILKNIHLTLKNNHYQINHNINRKVCYVSYDERKILLVDKNYNTNKKDWIGYDGKNEILLNETLYDDILNFRTEYIMVIRKQLKLTIQEEYDDYIKMVDEFKNKSNGEINFYKTGTVLRTAQKLFDETSKHLTPENLLLDESKLIQKSTQGSTIFYEKYEGIGYKSDIKSMFPFIMSGKNNLVPMKRGIFKHMTQNEFNEMKIKLNGNYAYGIYNIEILKSEDEKINRLFRFNELNEYTSIDLRNASFLGLEMKLIINENNNNVLLYPRSYCLTCEEVFGKYINKVYEYKKNKIDGAKLLLNILSGAIGEINKRKITVDEYDDSIEDIDLDELNLEPIKITHSRDKRYTTFTCVDKDLYFKSNFARFKPFLWAHARMLMSKIIKPINNIVKKCITDGIITTEPIECFDEIGKLAYEGYYPNLKIVNNASPIGQFQKYLP